MRSLLSRATVSLVLGATLASVGLVAQPATAAEAAAVNIIAVTNTGQLVQFSSNAKNITPQTITVSGVAPGYTLVANDLQPGTDVLFALARNAAGAVRLYSFSVGGGTATATQVGAADIAGVVLETDDGQAPGVGMTFTTADTIRVTSSKNVNFAINAATGAVTSPNTPFSPWSGCTVCTSQPSPSGIASNGSTTVVYDTGSDILVTLTGTATGSVARVLTPTVTSSRHAALDIADTTLWLTDEGQSGSNTSRLRALPLGSLGSAPLDPVIGTVQGLITSMAVGVPAGNGGAALDPSAKDFGAVNVGGSSAEQVFTFTNSGDIPLAGVTSTITGANASDFVRTSGTCAGQTLAAGQSCTVGIQLKPQSGGAKAATLTVSGTAGGATVSHVADLTGSGGAAGGQRLAGADRIGTAIEISKASYVTPTAGAVVLAKSTDYPDALAGTPLAVKQNAPLLLTPPNALDANVRTEMQRVLAPGRTVYILGGPAALSPAVETAVTTAGYTVKRVAGADRYETAVKIAQELGNPQTLLLATGINFPDALAGGAAAAEVNGAVLLTAGEVMPPSTAAYVGSQGSAQRFALGGPAAKAAPTATGIVGTDRYDTAAKVATQFFTGPTVVGIASGENFPDALAGGAHIGKLGGPLVLVRPSSVPAQTQSYLTANKATLSTAFVYGGPVAIADSVVAAVNTAIS